MIKRGIIIDIQKAIEASSSKWAIFDIVFIRIPPLELSTSIMT